jgi:cobalt-zinc-cadmium efflux system outer membrane protein
VTAAKANLRLQRSMAAPEFAVKGMYDRAGNFINNYFAVGVSLSVPIFNRNQGNIKSAKLEVLQSGQEEVYAVEKARMELYSAYNQLQRAIQLYQSSNNELESNFNQLIKGVNENFRKRNISMLEFIDYYQTYKETCLQLHELKKDVFLAMENLNMIVGQTVFNY